MVDNIQIENLNGLERIINSCAKDFTEAKKIIDNYTKLRKELKEVLKQRAIHSAYYCRLFKERKERKSSTKEIKYARKEELRGTNVEIKKYVSLLRNMRSELYGIIEKYPLVFNLVPKSHSRDDKGIQYSAENEVRVNLNDLVKKERSELVPHVQALIGPA